MNDSEWDYEWTPDENDYDEEQDARYDELRHYGPDLDDSQQPSPMKIRVNQYQAEKYAEGMLVKRLAVDPVYKNISDEESQWLYEARVQADIWSELESRYEIV